MWTRGCKGLQRISGDFGGGGLPNCPNGSNSIGSWIERWLTEGITGATRVRWKGIFERGWGGIGWRRWSGETGNGAAVGSPGNPGRIGPAMVFKVLESGCSRTVKREEQLIVRLGRKPSLRSPFQSTRTSCSSCYIPQFDLVGGSHDGIPITFMYCQIDGKHPCLSKRYNSKSATIAFLAV